MAAAADQKCAICGASVAPQPANKAFPFCSERCRLIDLGNWLGERYRVPTEEPEEPSPATPPTDSGDDDA